MKERIYYHVQTFKDVKSENWEMAYDFIYKILRNEFERHSELLFSDKISTYEKKYLTGMLNGEADENDVAFAFLNLSRMLHTQEAFMSKTIIYHGSNVAVPNPKILINGYYKDFGYGFYCTNFEKQAKRWALTKKGASMVNNYSYTENKNLKSLCFDEMTEEWLEFVVACRRGKEHDYDIVEGPMADDQIWDYVEDYIAGKISNAAFWELVKFKYPTHQIVFCTEAALSTLTFEGSATL